MAKKELLYLPDQDWSVKSPVTPRETLNESAAVTARESQLSVAADNSPLRVIYGTVRLGPQIATVISHNSELLILCVWGHGEIDSITSYTINDLAPVGGVTATHYMGTLGQVADPKLVAAFAARSPAVSYTDTLPGIAYSVVAVPSGGSTGFPRINAIIKGRKVWTGAANVWSDNPAWCLADFITNPSYGMNRVCDLASASSVATDCDVLVGGLEKSRTLNLALETVQPVISWLDTLRTYACCWVIPTATGLKLVSDKVPAGTTAVYSHTAGTIASIDSLNKRGMQDMPTVMTIEYTDTSILPWRTARAIAYAPGVLAGTTPRRESSVSLPGVQRYSQAYREAVERLNKLLLNDLSFNLGVFDKALEIDVGDVVEVTHPIGLTDKKMRVMGVSGEYGRYSLTLVEYDPAVYDSSIATAPTWADTQLPNPSDPPAVTGVTMVEEVYQVENGIWASRWRVTWTAAAYSFLASYRVELWAGAVLIDAANPTSNVWRTKSVVEDVVYTANVRAVSTVGAVGTVATQSGTPFGKFLIPTNVPSVSAFEAGGTVYIKWEPSIDIDIWKYEVRYGTSGWDTALVIDRLEALRTTSDQIPVGTWTIYVKAIDSVQQYSTTAASVSVTVTSDASAFIIDTKLQTAPTLTNMAEYGLERTDANRYFISEDGVMFGTKYSANVGTYTSALSTYHTSITSTWQGEAEDFGFLLGGQWTGTANVGVLSGSSVSYFGYGTASITTWVEGLSQKVNARFAALKHEALTTSTLQVVIPTQSIRIDAIPRSEAGSDTSSASNGKTQYLATDFLITKSISIAPQGSTSTSWTYDNVGRNVPNAADKAPNIVLTGNVITRTTAAVAFDAVRGKHPLPSTGKWYWECKVDNGGTYPNTVMLGVCSRTVGLTLNTVYSDANSMFYYGVGGYRYPGAIVYGAGFGTGDVIGIAYDGPNGQITFYKNNVSQGVISGLSGEKFPAVSIYNGTEQVTYRTLASDFSYTPPANFLPLPYAFDVYLFNQAGTKVAQSFLWTFLGV